MVATLPVYGAYLAIAKRGGPASWFGAFVLGNSLTFLIFHAVFGWA